MNGIIRKKAQIEILDFTLNNLCNSELSEIGRRAIKGIINRLSDDINELKNKTSDTDRD